MDNWQKVETITGASGHTEMYKAVKMCVCLIPKFIPLGFDFHLVANFAKYVFQIF